MAHDSKDVSTETRQAAEEPGEEQPATLTKAEASEHIDRRRLANERLQ